MLTRAAHHVDIFITFDRAQAYMADMGMLCHAWQVRQGLLEGQPCYEIYVMVGPMNKEDVKCAPFRDLLSTACSSMEIV